MLNMSMSSVPYLIYVETESELFKYFETPLPKNQEKCKLWLRTMMKYIKTLKPKKIIVIYARYDGIRLEKDLCEILEFSDGKLINKYEQLC